MRCTAHPTERAPPASPPTPASAACKAAGGETMAFKEGTLNFIADIPTTGQAALTFNFERQCAIRDDALSWLTRPAAEYVAEAAKVLALVAE